MTTPTPPVLPLASTGGGCCAPSALITTIPAPAATPDATPHEPTIYQVTGMTCGHCAGSVTEALSALTQVDDVKIALNAGDISTVAVTGAAPPKTVRRTIEKAGYTVLP